MRIQKENWKKNKVYVARNDKGQFVTYSKKVTAFESLKDFKNYVNSGSYKLGVSIYKNRSDNVKIGKTMIMVESDSLIKNVKNPRYVIVARVELDGKSYIGQSAIKTNFQKDTIEDGKIQALGVIAQQYTLRKAGFQTTNIELLERYEDEIENNLEKLKNNAEFSYRYSRKK